jgi:hypothetical protein
MHGTAPQHHVIVAHEVTNVGSDRDQLSSMAKQAREASETLSVVADRGYFKSKEILACHDAGITAYVSKPMQWMGATHFPTRKLAGVSAEMSLNVFAYNMKRVMKIIGANGLMKALSA